MPEHDTDIYSKIEAIIGLKLFDVNQVTEREKKSYQNFFNKKSGADSDADLLLKWYSKFMPDSVKDISRKITRNLRLSSIILVVISFIIGVSASGVLFYYDGTIPINVLPILTIFVFFPLLLLIASIFIPFFTHSDTNILSPLLHWIESKIEVYISRFNSKSSVKLNQGLSEYELVYNEPVLLLFKKTLQQCAAVYVVGALLWMLLNVTTTDLAFSWSTTLEIEGDAIYTITDVMSAPWSGILPAATVDYETVLTTRYFRGAQTDIMIASSGRWWAFLFMSIVFYGLLPRFLMYLFYKNRLNKSLVRSLIDSEEGHSILTVSEGKIIVETTEHQNSAVYPKPDQPIISDQKTREAVVLLWYLSDSDDGLIAEKLNRKIISIHRITGLSPTSKDKVISRKIADESVEHNNADIIVFVKFWESPNIRFEKTLREIASGNPKSKIKIIPLIEEPGQLNATNETNWLSRIALLNRELGSKKIYVELSESFDLKALL